VPSADKRQRKKENARAAREAREAAARRRKRTRTIIMVASVVVAFVALILIVNAVTGGSSKKKASAAASSTTTTAAKPEVALDPAKTYTADITTNYGLIKLKLDTHNAPIASAHFIKLARAGVYNGSRWHRVVKDFVIQGGAPGGDPNKNYGHSVVGEVGTNHYPLGTLAAAKTQNDPAGTYDAQFFIVSGSQGTTLPNDYAKFGSVTSGMNVVKAIEALAPATQEGGEPTKRATIDKVTITES
jgi:peptidyl-prolyl cis-trans isomerase B (cyclophilin B)